jgi:hypothetical protein
MPSFDHEFVVDLFRTDGALAVELLETCAGLAVDHARVELGSIDLSQVAPTEYRADVVVVLHDRADRPVIGIIVEVQRQIERDKLLTWPLRASGRGATRAGGAASRAPSRAARRRGRSSRAAAL